MKYLSIVLLCGLFVLTASAQKPVKADLIVSGIQSGTTYAVIFGKIGKPQRESELGELDGCTQGRGKTLSYDGLTIETMGDETGANQTLLDMEITSSKWVTSKGVKIGDNYKTVQAKYGKTVYERAYERPTEEKVYTGEKWLVYDMNKNGPGGIMFYFKNDRLVRIHLKATTC